MALEITSDTLVARDEDGNVKQISHPLKPFFGDTVTPEAPTGVVAGAMAAPDPRALAEAYLREALPTFGVDQAIAESASASLVADAQIVRDESQQLHVAEEKVSAKKATISYAQTMLGIPVWRAGFSVRMRGEPLGVIGSSSTIEREFGDIVVPEASALYLPGNIDAATLAELLNLESPVEITRKRLLVFPYSPHDRGNALGERASDGSVEACPTVSPPEVPDSINEGTYYVVTEVMFSYTAPGWGPLNWEAMIEPQTGAALRVEALVSCVDGTVLLRDPLTTNGTNTEPDAPSAALDALRDVVELPDALDDGNEHRLEGRFVTVRNVSPPNLAAPTTPLGQQFQASVPTDDFAAINGYYHCDQCFRLVENLGFDVEEYFDGTNFPVTVDHRATIGGQANSVNAQAPGNSTSDGSDGFRFALLAPNSTIGMAVEQRVTWHEFGHALLWDHLNSPNFRFAHSPGDTIASILLDPDSNAPDPGRTFPWTIITRRHDHAPASGFGWGGVRDDPFPVGSIISGDRAGYAREQILSSTLFRLYRSAGGGSADPQTRRDAAQRTVWLILETISALSPFAQPQNAEDFFNLMIEAEVMSTSTVRPIARGLLPKVLRWSFEQQGLFQPPGAPTPVTTPGAPPSVDVFIDDGRGGGYDEAEAEQVEPPGLVIRTAADSGTSHQQPAEGETGFVYLTVQNRGQETATDVTAQVVARQVTDGTDWAHDWDPLTATNGAGSTFSVAPGEEVRIGPFEWTPQFGGDWFLFADVDCPEDRSLVRSTFSGTCPVSTVAMMDNNASSRRVSVSPATG
ncbi:hypothetical protein [uncultured Roseovarius sp.]|uniref:hypothetical protein n=1 Tax=uncultured Roseovarius sp. TaxID=293344 RepID=UPI00263A15DA|nr:hypothetical protein [uncultured Roseovarius sp.]